MTVGLSATAANAILNALCRSTPWAEPAALWVQPHIGDPGAAGTSNPAVETTRKQATFGSDAVGGSIANTVALTWTAVPASEDWSHVSVWDASTGGVFQFSAVLTANALVIGDTSVIPIGWLVAAFGIAS